jgi:uncharacterized membrane protein YfcA
LSLIIGIGAAITIPLSLQSGRFTDAQSLEGLFPAVLFITSGAMLLRAKNQAVVKRVLSITALGIVIDASLQIAVSQYNSREIMVVLISRLLLILIFLGTRRLVSKVV